MTKYLFHAYDVFYCNVTICEGLPMVLFKKRAFLVLEYCLTEYLFFHLSTVVTKVVLMLFVMYE